MDEAGHGAGSEHVANISFWPLHGEAPDLKPGDLPWRPSAPIDQSLNPSPLPNLFCRWDVWRPNFQSQAAQDWASQDVASETVGGRIYSGAIPAS